MRTWIAAMLLASVTAVPAYAQDHDHDGHGDGQHQGGQHQGGQNGGGQHGGGQGGQHAGGGAPAQAPRVQPQVQPGGGAGFAPRSVAPGGVRPATPAVSGGEARHYGGRPEGGVQVWQGQGQPGGRPGFDPRQGGRDDHGRPVVNGNNAVRDWNGARRDDGRGWNDGRGDRGQDRGQGWNGSGGRPGGGDWNRGWRQDRRYDWQGWRAQHGDVFRAGRYRPPYGAGWGYRRYSAGYRIDPIFFAQDYWISNPDYYRLPPAYGPYRWVRYYNDALLIDLRDGVVVDAIPDFFY